MSRLAQILIFLTALAPWTALAEGTWQLGANQDFHPYMKFRVDVLKAGEVINIAAGINTDDYPKPLLVHVKDPSGKNVSGSPFTISLNTKGWLGGHGKLPPATVTNPLQVADLLKKNRWVKKVRIEGHTDTRGKDDYNMELSDRRARSVMKYLVENGVEASRLTAQGFGEDKPIASNKTNRGRAKNRRVEFIIIDPKLD